MVDRPSFWLEEDSPVLIDQRQLPGRTTLIRANTIEKQAEAIYHLAIRGAPAIGVFGALSLALAIKRGEDPRRSYKTLLDTRPTAVDLRNCMDVVMADLLNNGKESVLDSALELMETTIRSCERIGKAGEHLISDGSKVMTHCNAGALATVDWGTALAPIRMAARNGKRPFVWVSETRPLLQGARLTAWELMNEGIDHRIIVDSSSGHLLSRGEVDLIIVGADRVASNGDIANKIGTLEKAIIAREFGIPFYVAFPGTTMDPLCKTGMDIPIEVRSDDEILRLDGVNTSPEGSKAFNPAFDVTPYEYITGYVTEEGILSKDDLNVK